MPVKKYKPTTPGRRKASVVSFKELTRNPKSPKSLRSRKTGQAGRNFSGSISVRHKGGGARQFVRQLDFDRLDKTGVPATVKTLEYDPGRTAFIARIAYRDGAQRYIIAPHGLKVGQTIMCDPKAEITPGNRLPLASIPVGTFVHDVELIPGMGGKIARSAGNYALLQTTDSGYALLKLPSGEIRKVRESCMATVGTISNPDNMNVRIGKAGRMRHMGVRPSVRGKAMNPVDHPHGGGKGANPIGLKRGPQTPWGRHALGVKTRDKKKASWKMIVKRRK